MKKWMILLLLIAGTGHAQKKKDYELKVRKDSSGVYLIAKNHLFCNTTLSLADSVKQRTIKKVIVKSKDSAIILRGTEKTKEEFLQTFNALYKVSYSFGDSISSKPEKDFLYTLPFEKRKRYKIMQSWGGQFSHTSEQSYHAIDFKMKIGQPVHAARGGVVVSSVEKYKKNGGRDMINYANQIVILHTDGTLAFYVHLKHKGSLVATGQQVKQGELIGYSGNTGFSSKPHLHFVVRDGNTRSIPIYFKGYPNQQLVSGRTYRSN